MPVAELAPSLCSIAAEAAQVPDQGVDLLRGDQLAECRHDPREPARATSIVNDGPPSRLELRGRLVALAEVRERRRFLESDRGVRHAGAVRPVASGAAGAEELLAAGERLEGPGGLNRRLGIGAADQKSNRDQGGRKPPRHFARGGGPRGCSSRNVMRTKRCASSSGATLSSPGFLTKTEGCAISDSARSRVRPSMVARRRARSRAKSRWREKRGRRSRPATPELSPTGRTQTSRPYR